MKEARWSASERVRKRTWKVLFPRTGTQLEEQFLSGDGVTSHCVLGEPQPPLESSGLMLVWGKRPLVVTDPFSDRFYFHSPVDFPQS